jgi:hypothetical protein
LPESYIGRFGTGLVDADAASVGGIIDSVYPDPVDLDIVLIGDAARIGAAAEQLGPVSRMALADPDFAPPASAH